MPKTAQLSMEVSTVIIEIQCRNGNLSQMASCRYVRQIREISQLWELISAREVMASELLFSCRGHRFGNSSHYRLCAPNGARLTQAIRRLTSCSCACNSNLRVTPKGVISPLAFKRLAITYGCTHTLFAMQMHPTSFCRFCRIQMSSSVYLQWELTK